MNNLDKRLDRADTTARLLKAKAKLPPELAGLPMSTLTEVTESVGKVMRAVLEGSVTPTVGNTFAALAGRIIDALKQDEIRQLAEQVEEFKQMIENIKAQRANGAIPPAPRQPPRLPGPGDPNDPTTWQQINGRRLDPTTLMWHRIPPGEPGAI